jgi:predicted phage terminase large subunit-like protein
MPEELVLEDLLNKVNYNRLKSYIPSKFSLNFINFVKLASGTKGLENKTPLFHYEMLDQLMLHENNLFVVFRGGSKTSLLHEFLILYIAAYGSLDGVTPISVGMYISDTMENGVKNMRNNLEFRYNTSDFLRKYIPTVRFTDPRWEFKNLEGKSLVIRGFGSSTGVRGFKEYGQRPTICLQDDLLSDKNSSSPTIIGDIEDIIYKAARHALHPSQRLTIWTGTPFNKKDPLYKAAGSSAWNTKVYPICERFPCDEGEFIGAWEDRFSYMFVKREYERLSSLGKTDAFNQELMLRILSDEDRLVQDSDILFYDRMPVLQDKASYNFYITTDFATSTKEKADYSVISVWAYSANREWLYVDGILKRQDMAVTINDLFRLVSMYKPLSVGVEKSGQQKGFISWIKREMIIRDIWFIIASDKEHREEGFTCIADKLTRFNVALPFIKQGLVKFPTDMKQIPILQEAIQELKAVTYSGIKSKHDDFIDTVSQLPLLNPYPPSPSKSKVDDNSKDIFSRDRIKPVNPLSSYLP